MQCAEGGWPAGCCLSRLLVRHITITITTVPCLSVRKFKLTHFCPLFTATASQTFANCLSLFFLFFFFLLIFFFSRICSLHQYDYTADVESQQDPM